MCLTPCSYLHALAHPFVLADLLVSHLNYYESTYFGSVTVCLCVTSKAKWWGALCYDKAWKTLNGWLIYGATWLLLCSDPQGPLLHVPPLKTQQHPCCPQKLETWSNMYIQPNAQRAQLRSRRRGSCSQSSDEAWVCTPGISSARHGGDATKSTVAATAVEFTEGSMGMLSDTATAALGSLKAGWGCVDCGKLQLYWYDVWRWQCWRLDHGVVFKLHKTEKLCGHHDGSVGWVGKVNRAVESTSSA